MAHNITCSLFFWETPSAFLNKILCKVFFSSGLALANFVALPDCRRHNCLHCKDTIPKFQTNIPRKGIARPQFLFLHSCVCERFIYSNDQSAYSAARKYVNGSWEYINRSQTNECGNRDWGRTIPFLGIHKWDFRGSAFSFYLLYFLFAPSPEIITWDITFMKLTSAGVKQYQVHGRDYKSLWFS